MRILLWDFICLPNPMFLIWNKKAISAPHSWNICSLIQITQLLLTKVSSPHYCCQAEWAMRLRSKKGWQKKICDIAQIHLPVQVSGNKNVSQFGRVKQNWNLKEKLVAAVLHSYLHVYLQGATTLRRLQPPPVSTAGEQEGEKRTIYDRLCLVCVLHFALECAKRKEF